MANALTPIDVTEFGIFISSNNEQSKKVDDSIMLNEEGIDIVFSDKHPSKAAGPIRKTEFDIVTFSKDKHPLNDFSPITFIDEGIEISLSFFAFSKQNGNISLLSFNISSTISLLLH